MYEEMNQIISDAIKERMVLAAMPDDMVPEDNPDPVDPMISAMFNRHISTLT